MAQKKITSPGGLEVRGSPFKSARLSPKAALGAVATLSLILGFIVINISDEAPKAKAKESAKATLQPALSEAKSLTMNVPDIADSSKQVAVPTLPAAAAPSPPLLAKTEDRTSAKTVANEEDKARLAGTEVPGFSTAAFDNSSSAFSARDGGAVESAGVRDAMGVANALVNGAGNNSEESDPNRQREKLAFLNQSRASGYLDSSVTPPRSPYELKTGVVIPGVLLSELNSDLPGEIVAQVARNVYDTATGNHVLIPQGTRLFGHYDSNVAFGQGRLLVSWQRLIFPDASTLELDGMGGYDRAGNSGFAGKVNNHYGRIFGWSLLTSVIAAGYQISQPQQDSTLTPLSDQQVAAGAVGQQMAQLGQEIARRNLRVQPTIQIPKGYRLHVMVNKDIEFPGAWQR